MRYITAEEILLIHHQLIERYGGSHGTRDVVRIASICAAPAQNIFGTEQYDGICAKAAVYARNIIADHAFVDGNKRTGITTAIMFLQLNGHDFQAAKGEIEDFAVYIAVKKLAVDVVANWLQVRCSQIT